MNLCAKCGSPLPPESKFCNICGAPVSAPVNQPVENSSDKMLNCKSCGAELPVDSLFCGQCGAKTAEDSVSDKPSEVIGKVRCASCGSIVSLSEKACEKCGKPAMEMHEYLETLTSLRKVRKIRNGRAWGLFFIILFLLLPAITLLYPLIRYPSESIHNGGFTVFSAFLFLLIVSLLIRSGKLKKKLSNAGISKNQYTQLLQKCETIPSAFFEQIPDEPKKTYVASPPLQPTRVPEKKKSGKGAGVLFVFAALVMVFVVMLSFGINPLSLIGGDISGRWVSYDSYSSGGMTTESNIAIYFHNGKAYIGDAAYSNSELASGKAQTISTYYVIPGKLVLNRNGKTYSYKYDGKYIYMGSRKLHHS
ncbi:MAG: zinc ribbon domain-containing protein [Clostridia bacterium]|nr:zinc ribbon domain-containing protein [Clostridia bacterium]